MNINNSELNLSMSKAEQKLINGGEKPVYYLIASDSKKVPSEILSSMNINDLYELATKLAEIASRKALMIPGHIKPITHLKIERDLYDFNTERCHSHTIWKYDVQMKKGDTK